MLGIFLACRSARGGRLYRASDDETVGFCVPRPALESDLIVCPSNGPTGMVVSVASVLRCESSISLPPTLSC